MSWFSTLMIVALLASAVARADDGPQKRTGRDEADTRKEQARKLSSEDRDSRGKEGRKTNGAPFRGDLEKRRDALKNMSPEERAAKRKEIKGRLEKRIAELRGRKSNGTLSQQEARELERREQILKRFEQEGNSPRIERPRPVLTNAPVEK